jgi:hypothetical protein
MAVLWIALLTGVAALAALALLAHKAFSSSGELPIDAAWIDDLSIERYRPMMRLLDERDFEFLKMQPGFTPRLAARLRMQRCQIFRSYVSCLESDFQRVCMAVKVLLLQASQDRPDLAVVLIRRQVAFACAMALVNIRVFLYRWGIGGVDVSALVGAFDAMRLELRTLVPAASGALA